MKSQTRLVGENLAAPLGQVAHCNEPDFRLHIATANRCLLRKWSCISDGTSRARMDVEVFMPAAVELSADEQESYRRSHRWGAAVKAALIAGVIVWMFPAGNPWTSFARPSGAHIMGRTISMDQSITQLSAAALPAHIGHFAVSIVYAVIILTVVYRLRSWRAIVAGVGASLVLYGINFAAFRMFAPQFTGPWEANIALAHVLFGGITAAVIRGFLRPPMRLDEAQPNPGPRYP